MRIFQMMSGLRNARHANKMGKKLSEGLAKHNSIKLAYPTEANEVFAKFPRNMIEHLNSEGYKMNEDELDGTSCKISCCLEYSRE